MRKTPPSSQGIPLSPSSVGDDCGPSLTPLAHSGFSYVDLVEGLHDGHFYALKRILCHEQQDREEAQREADMHRLFHHPNILRLVACCLRERGTKHEAWLLLPFFKVRKSPSYGGGCNRDIYPGLCEQASMLRSRSHVLSLTTSDLGFRGTQVGLACVICAVRGLIGFNIGKESGSGSRGSRKHHHCGEICVAERHAVDRDRKPEGQRQLLD